MRKTSQPRRVKHHGHLWAKAVPKSQNDVSAADPSAGTRVLAMKTFVRSVALASSLLGALALAPHLAHAAGRGAGVAHAGGSWNGGHGGNWNGGHAGHGWYGHPGGYWRGGYGYWGGGYWPYWGLGVGLGIGAIGYWGGYPYYGGYYAAYPYYGYGGYYDAPANVGDTTYSTVDPGTGTRAGQPVPQGTHAPDPIYYPKNGQSAATTESDRRECNRWATTQAGAMNDASIFQRATFACMEGRGYTVR